MHHTRNDARGNAAKTHAVRLRREERVFGGRAANMRCLRAAEAAADESVLVSARKVERSALVTFIQH